jgi:hypothetical protein
VKWWSGAHGSGVAHVLKHVALVYMALVYYVTLVCEMVEWRT